MNVALAEGLGDARLVLSTRHDVNQRAIIRDHGEDDGCVLAGGGDCLRLRGAGGDERLHASRGPVPDAHVVSRLDQVASHAAAHRAKANESNTHQYLRIRSHVTPPALIT